MYNTIKENWYCRQYEIKDVLFVLLPAWSAVGVGLILFLFITATLAAREVLETTMDEVGFIIVILINIFVGPYIITSMWITCALSRSYTISRALLIFLAIWLMPIGCSGVYFFFLRKGEDIPLTGR